MLDSPEVVKIFRFVIDPLVKLLFAAAVFYFMYGVFKYIKDSDEASSRIDGANHVLWSTVGLFIMISVWGIIEMLQRTIGVS
jgi:hypothetical protein